MVAMEQQVREWEPPTPDDPNLAKWIGYDFSVSTANT